MIKYDKLRKTMKEKNVSWYKLAKAGIGNSTLDKLKRNESVTINTINTLCKLLNCRVEDIMEYVEEENE